MVILAALDKTLTKTTVAFISIYFRKLPNILLVNTLKMINYKFSNMIKKMRILCKKNLNLDLVSSAIKDKAETL